MSSSLYKLLYSNQNQSENEVKDTGSTLLALGGLGYGLKKTLESDVFEKKHTHILNIKKEFQRTTKPTNELGEAGFKIKKNVERISDTLKKTKQQATKEFADELLTDGNFQKLLEAENEADARALIASLYDTVVSNQANIDDSDAIKSLLRTSYDDVSTLDNVDKQTLETFFKQNISSDPKTISQFKSNYSQKRKVKNLLTSSTDANLDGLYKDQKKYETSIITNLQQDFHGKKDPNHIYNKVNKRFNSIQGLLNGTNVQLQLVGIDEFGEDGIKSYYAKMTFDQKRSLNIPLHIHQNADGLAYVRATSNMTSRYVPPLHVIDGVNLVKTGSGRSISDTDLKSAKIGLDDYIFNNFMNRYSTREGYIDLTNLSNRDIDAIHGHIRDLSESAPRTQVYGNQTDRLVQTLQMKSVFGRSTIPIVGLENYDRSTKEKILPMIMRATEGAYGGLSGGQATLRQLDDPFNRGKQITYGMLQSVREGKSPIEQLMSFSGSKVTRDVLPQTAREGQMFGKGVAIAQPTQGSIKVGLRKNISLVAQGSNLIGLSAQADSRITGMNLPDMLFFNESKIPKLGLAEGMSHINFQPNIKYDAVKTVVDQGIAKFKAMEKLKETGNITLNNPDEITQFFKEYGHQGEIIFGTIDNRFASLKRQGDMQRIEISLTETSVESGRTRDHLHAIVTGKHGEAKMYGLSMKDTVNEISRHQMKAYIGRTLDINSDEVDQLLTKYYGKSDVHLRLGTTDFTKKSVQYIQSAMYGGYLQLGGDKGQLDNMLKTITDESILNTVNSMSSTKKYNSLAEAPAKLVASQKLLAFSGILKQAFDNEGIDIDKQSRVFSYLTHLAMNNEKDLSEKILKQHLNLDDRQMNIFQQAAEDGYIVTNTFKTVGTRHQELVRNPAKTEARFANYLYASLRGIYGFTPDEATGYISSLVQRQQGIENRLESMTSMKMMGYSVGSVADDLVNKQYEKLGIEKFSSEEIDTLRAFKQGQEKDLVDFLSTRRQGGILDLKQVITDEDLLTRVTKKFGGKTEVFLPGAALFENLLGMEIKSSGKNIQLEHALTRSTMDLINSIFGFEQVETLEDFTKSMTGLEKVRSDIGEIVGTSMRNVSAGRISGSGTYLGKGFYVAGKGEKIYHDDPNINSKISQKVKSVFNLHKGYVGFGDAQMFLDGMTTFQEALQKESYSGEESRKILGQNIRDFFIGMHRPESQFTGHRVLTQRNPVLGFGHILPDLPMYRMDISPDSQTSKMIFKDYFDKHRFREFTDTFKDGKIFPEITKRQSEYVTTQLNLSEKEFTTIDNYFEKTKNLSGRKTVLNQELNKLKLKKINILESISKNIYSGRAIAKVESLKAEEEFFKKLRTDLYESKYNLQNRTTNVDYLLGLEKINNEKNFQIKEYKVQANQKLRQEIEKIHLDPDESLTFEEKNKKIASLEERNKTNIDSQVKQLKDEKKLAINDYKEKFKDNRSIDVDVDLHYGKSSNLENIYKKTPLGVVDAYTEAAIEYQANKQLLPDLIKDKKELLDTYGPLAKEKSELKKKDPYRIMSIDKDTGEIKYSKGLTDENKQAINESFEKVKIIKQLKREQLQQDIVRFKKILKLKDLGSVDFDNLAHSTGRSIKGYLIDNQYAIESISPKALEEAGVSENTKTYLSSLKASYLPEEIANVPNKDIKKLKGIISNKIQDVDMQIKDIDIEQDIKDIDEAYKGQRYEDLNPTDKYYKSSVDKINRIEKIDKIKGLTQTDYVNAMIHQYESLQADPHKMSSARKTNSNFINTMDNFYGTNKNRKGLNEYFKEQLDINTDYLGFERTRFDQQTGDLITEDQRFMSPLTYTFLNLTQGSGTSGIDEQISTKRSMQKKIKDINKTLLDNDFYERKDILQNDIEDINRPFKVHLSDSGGYMPLGNIYKEGKSINKQAIDHYQQKINNINEKINNIRNERQALIEGNKETKERLRTQNIDPINQELDKLRQQKQSVQEQINKRLAVQEQIKAFQQQEDFKAIPSEVFQDFRQQDLADDAFKTSESKIPELRRLERFYGKQIESEEDLVKLEAKLNQTPQDQLNVEDFRTMRALDDATGEMKTKVEEIESKFNLQDDYLNLYLKIHQRHLDYAPQGGGKFYMPEMSITSADLVNEKGLSIGSYTGRMDFNRFSIGDYDGDIYQVFFNTKTKEQTRKLTEKITSEKMYDYGSRFLLQMNLLNKGMKAYGKRMGSASMDLMTSQIDELAKEQLTKEVGGLDVQVKTGMLSLVQHASSMGEDAFEQQFKSFKSGAALISVAQEVLNLKAKKLPLAANIAGKFTSLLKESYKTGKGEKVADFFFNEIFKDGAFEKAQSIGFSNIQFEGVTDEVAPTLRKTLEEAKVSRQDIYSTFQTIAEAGKKYGTAMIGSNAATAYGLMDSDKPNAQLFTELFSRYGTIEGGLLGAKDEEIIDIVNRTQNAVTQSKALFNIPKMSGAVGLGVAAIGALGALKGQSSLSDVNAKFSDMRSRELLSSANLYKNQQEAMGQVSPENLNPVENFYQRPINTNQTVVQSHTNTHIYGEAPTMSSMAMLGRTMMSTGGTSNMFINDNRQPLSRHYINDLMTG